jgi:hypothetical protein
MRKFWLLGCLVGLLPFCGSGQLGGLRAYNPPPDFQGRVEGSPLMFDSWQKATVISQSPLFENDSLLLFNFDLGSQTLLATADQKTQIRINRKEFQSVEFYQNNVSVCMFEHVPVINDKDLFMPLVEDSGRYSLYQLLHVGIRNHVYVQWSEYYILFPPPDGHVVRLKVLDRRLIARAFNLNPDSKKVQEYLSEDKTTTLISEYDLRRLILLLDQPD